MKRPFHPRTELRKAIDACGTISLTASLDEIRVAARKVAVACQQVYVHTPSERHYWWYVGECNRDARIAKRKTTHSTNRSEALTVLADACDYALDAMHYLKAENRRGPMRQRRVES